VATCRYQKHSRPDTAAPSSPRWAHRKCRTGEESIKPWLTWGKATLGFTLGTGSKADGVVAVVITKKEGRIANDMPANALSRP
jgi:hypothetical protein